MCVCLHKSGHSQLANSIKTQTFQDVNISIFFLSQAYKIQGLALKFLHQYKEALTSFLTALDLDPDSSDELTDHIADVAAQLCNIPEKTRTALKGKYLTSFLIAFHLDSNSS